MLVLKEYNEYTYNDAVLAALRDGYEVVCNKTTSWKRYGKPYSVKGLKAFALQVFDKERIFDTPGKGIMIILENGKENDCKYPSRFIPTNNGRPYKKERAIQIRRKDNDQIVGTLYGKDATKRKAIPFARRLSIVEKTDLYMELFWHVKDDNGIIGEFVYDPNLRYQPGKYIFIGNELNKFEPLIKYTRRW